MRLLMQVLSSSSVFFSVGLGMDNDVQFRSLETPHNPATRETRLT